MTKIYQLTGTNITLEDVALISHARPGEIWLEIHPDSLLKMKKSRQLILNIVKIGKPVYGNNTGFGALAKDSLN